MRQNLNGWVGCQPSVSKKLIENQISVFIDIRSVGEALILTPDPRLLSEGYNSDTLPLNHSLRTKTREGFMLMARRLDWEFRLCG